MDYQMHDHYQDLADLCDDPRDMWYYKGYAEGLIYDDVDIIGINPDCVYFYRLGFTDGQGDRNGDSELGPGID